MLHRLQRVRSRGEYSIRAATLDTGGSVLALTLEFAGNPILYAWHQLLALDSSSAGQRGGAPSGLVPHMFPAVIITLTCLSGSAIFPTA